MITGFRFALDGRAATAPARVWLGLPLAARQERAFLEAGHRFSEMPLDAGRAIAIREDVAITTQAVDLLAREGAAREQDVAWGCTGRIGAFLDEVALGDDGPLAVYLHDGGSADPGRLAEAERLSLDLGERLLELPVSRAQFGADVLELPLADALVAPTAHWLQHLWANLLGLGPFLWRGLAGRNIVEVAVRLSWAALRAGSIQPARVAAKLGRRGRGCRIHPAAVVEGCWLGDAVEIGAGAVVRGSVLSDGAIVEDQALVEYAVLDKGARVQRQAMCKFSVLGRGAAMAGTMQLGVVGADAAVKFGAVLMDMTLDEGVRVPVGDSLVLAPLGLAGVCVGEGALVGSGVRIAPGRAIPAGVTVLPAPESILRRIPEDTGGTCVVRDGALVRL